MFISKQLFVRLIVCVAFFFFSESLMAQGKISRSQTLYSAQKVTFQRMDQLSDEVAYRAKGSNGKYGVMDREGNLILPCKFTWVDPFRQNRSHVQLKKDGKYAIINEKGEFITDYIYDGVWNAYEERIKVSNYDSEGNYKSGFIDLDGHIIIPIIYDTPSDAKWIYVDGKVKLSLNGEVKWFDRNGNEIPQ